MTVHNFYRQKESGFRAQPQLNFSNPIYIQVTLPSPSPSANIASSGMGIGSDNLKCFSSEFVPGSEMNLLQFYEMGCVKNENSAERKIMGVLAPHAPGFHRSVR